MDVKIITEPDYDLSNRFKIFLFDFEWKNIERYSYIFTESDRDICIYIFEPNNKNYEWAVNAANQADCILINCGQITSNEFLKGFLLSFNNSAAFGDNKFNLIAKTVFNDLAVWFTKISQKFNLINV